MAGPSNYVWTSTGEPLPPISSCRSRVADGGKADLRLPVLEGSCLGSKMPFVNICIGSSSHLMHISPQAQAAQAELSRLMPHGLR